MSYSCQFLHYGDDGVGYFSCFSITSGVELESETQCKSLFSFHLDTNYGASVRTVCFLVWTSID